MPSSRQDSESEGINRLPLSDDEPGLGIDPRILFSREEASEILADSILALIERGWAFKHESIFWRREHYTLRRWNLSVEAATLWNRYYAPIVKRHTEGQDLDTSGHQRLANALASKASVTTEVIVSLTLLLCEVWKENLLLHAVRAIDEGTERSMYGMD